MPRLLCTVCGYKKNPRSHKRVTAGIVGRADSRFAKGTITLTVLFYRIHAAAGSAGLQFAKGTDALTVLFFRIQASVRIRGTLEKNEGTNKGGSHARASPYLLFNFNDAGIYWNPFIRFI